MNRILVLCTLAGTMFDSFSIYDGEKGGRFAASRRKSEIGLRILASEKSTSQKGLGFIFAAVPDLLFCSAARTTEMQLHTKQTFRHTY